MPTKNLSEYREMFIDAVEADKKHFMEQRSSLLLFSGKHHNANREVTIGGGHAREFARITQSSSGTKRALNQLRIVYNQIPRLTDSYVNEIMDHAPGVQVVPVGGGDVKNSRLAKMNMDVLEADMRKNPDHEMRTEEEAETFTVLGEVACKLFWDEATDWLKESPIHPFDLVRAPGSLSLETAPWLIHRNVYTKVQLIKMFGRAWAEKYASPGGGKGGYDSGMGTYTTFNAQDREYQKLDGLEILEYYHRPERNYPKGYYVFFTHSAILREGELPGGIFPIVAARCMTTPSLARGHSFIRSVYNAQMELNRAAGQDASNMIHFGDDKIITNASSNLSLGKENVGVTHYKVSSFTDLNKSIQYVEGKGLPKYLEYMAHLIKFMDYTAQVKTVMDEKKDGRTGDIYYQLFSRLKDKKKFAKIGRRFENYLKMKAEAKLAFFRYYLTPEDIVETTDLQDKVLIEDFKNTTARDYSIALKVGNTSTEELMGKQLQIREIVQYLGNNLSREDIGMILRESPLSNNHALLDSLTAKYDSSVNDIIKLEKGILPQVSRTADLTYKIERITNHINGPRFQELGGQVTNLFHQFLDQLQQMLQEQKNEELRLQAGFIPTTGALINTDLYIEVPSSSGAGKKTVRAKLPQSALQWLFDTLQKQGMTSQSMAGLPAQTRNEVLSGVEGPAAQLSQQQPQQAPRGLIAG